MATTNTDVQKQERGIGDGHVAQPGSAQANEALIRKMINALNERNVSKVLPFYADNAVTVNVPVNRTHQGHAGFSEFLNNWATAFPDYKLELTNILCTADKAAVEFTARATHTGTLASPMGNLPATNRRVEIKFNEFYELTNGKITKNRSYWDTSSLMSQLGTARWT
jgi:steroid delta-isomerase-like uncharacterized protein